MEQQVQQYMDSLSPELRSRCMVFREKIRALAGACEEGVAYGIPFIARSGKRIIYYGVTKKWVALYPEAEAVEVFTEKLAGYSTSKGTIRFPHTKEIDYALIGEIIAYRIELQGL